jgi:hypothetical protein
LSVGLDANTYFEQPVTSLLGQMVEVEGVLGTEASSLRARKVKRAR